MIVPFSIWVTNGHSVSTPNLLRITYKGDYNKNEKDVTFLKKGVMTYSCLHGMIMKIKQYRKRAVCTEEEKQRFTTLRRK